MFDSSVLPVPEGPGAVQVERQQRAQHEHDSEHGELHARAPPPTDCRSRRETGGKQISLSICLTRLYRSYFTFVYKTCLTDSSFIVYAWKRFINYVRIRLHYVVKVLRK